MNRHLWLPSLIALAVGLTPTPTPAATSHIQIEQCFVTVPKHFSHNASGTQIVYVNRGWKAATSITFAVAYRNAQNNFLRRVTDQGNFQPGVTINHHFALYNDITYAGKQTGGCKATHVTWADGTHWSL
jgi:hypothetical protein